MTDVDETHIESVPPTVKPRTGLGLVRLALFIPVLSGIWLCFVTSFPIALCISTATVIATAALVSIDAIRLGQVDLKGRQRESAGLLFVGMCLLWIVVYPFAFFRRSAFGSPHLGFVALFVTAFFIGVPFFVSMVLPVGLPTCTSDEVKLVLEQVIRTTSVGANARSIDGHRELSYDRNVNMRLGECVAHIDSGDVPVKFIVEWQDRKKGLFQVRLAEPELPSCTNAEVKQLLERAIRTTPLGATARSIDGHRELSYDRNVNMRLGECVAHIDAVDVPVKFFVEWQNREKGLFQVRLAESELPSCTSAEVKLVLEQALRTTPLGATARSIDGHRELSYDRKANTRHGECVAHTDSGDVPVKFIVEWQNREKGLFQVRLLDPTN